MSEFKWLMYGLAVVCVAGGFAFGMLTGVARNDGMEKHLHDAQEQAGANYICSAEINPLMEVGYEIICRAK